MRISDWSSDVCSSDLWEHEILSLTREDLRRFYESWYAPNNAILVISGDVTAAEVRPLVEKHYGKIPARPLPERINWIEPPKQTDRRVTLKDPQVHQPSWSRTYLGPSYIYGNSLQAYADRKSTRLNSSH